MKKNGFTLVELLVSIALVALLGGIAVISYQTFFSSAEETYYKTIESNIMLAASDYFTDHRDELPVGDGYSDVSINKLVSARYIEQVVDSNGKSCNNGTVYAYREDNKYKYEVCLYSCGNHISKGNHCSTN